MKASGLILLLTKLSATRAKRRIEAIALSMSRGLPLNADSRLTYKVIERLVAGFSKFDDNNRGRFVGFEDDLINIVLTLHRQNDEQLKTDSLKLYEDLMRLEITGVFERLRQLDHRPAT